MLLFPGQGSPYPNMARETAVHIAELRDAIELADRVLADEFSSPLSSMIYPDACGPTLLPTWLRLRW